MPYGRIGISIAAPAMDTPSGRGIRVGAVTLNP
jgi:hypothetical protein